MTRHEVDRAALDELIVQLTSVTEFSQSLLEQVDAIKQTVSAEWTGEANAQYQALHAEWVDGARKMTVGVQQLTAHATIAADNYEQAAAHVQAIWS